MVHSKKIITVTTLFDYLIKLVALVINPIKAGGSERLKTKFPLNFDGQLIVYTHPPNVFSSRKSYQIKHHHYSTARHKSFAIWCVSGVFFVPSMPVIGTPSAACVRD